MATPRKHILFVDDEEAFLGVLREILGQLAGEDWTIHTAPDVARALALLQTQPIDLLVLDVHMPVVDGLQFLGLLRRTYPNLPRVALSGDTSETFRAACLNAGAMMYLEKPVTAAGWHSLYAALNELVKVPPGEGFRGVLRTVGLQDILQMECLGRSSSVLEVTTPGFVGRIFIRAGEIIHAEAGDRAGEEAFNYLLALRAGEFNLLPFTDPPQRTLHEPWEFLLMEAARKRDEAAGLPQAQEPPPAAPAPAPAAPGPGLPPSPPPDSLPTAVSPGSLWPAAEADPEARPVIEEVLVASPQGDVLFEWQCHQASERIRFLEGVSERARQMSQALPLGLLERFEMEDGPVRCLAHVQAERTVLVRRRLHPVGAADEPRRP